MALNLYTLKNSLTNLLSKNNTTTSSLDISNGLYARIVSVDSGYHQSQPISSATIPRIFVELKSKTEEFGMLGLAAKRQSTVVFNIVGIVQTGLGQVTGRTVSDDQMVKLADNVETLLRNYPKLSCTSYVLQSLLTGTEYDVVESNDTYNSIVRIGLTVETLTT